MYRPGKFLEDKDTKGRSKKQDQDTGSDDLGRGGEGKPMKLAIHQLFNSIGLTTCPSVKFTQ